MIEVLSPGSLTTIQDLGRSGFSHLGVSAAGAADALALRVANRLVGNPETAAGLEMTLKGGRFLFHEPAVIALCGASFDANVAFWETVAAPAGFTLEAGGSQRGVRLYLVVKGGVRSELTMGSASTHLLSGLGGPLQRGQILTVGPSSSGAPRRTASYEYRKRLRVTPGAGSSDFPPQAWDTLLSGTFTVSNKSNRQGIRLSGDTPIASPGGGTMESEGVALGAIQIPANGEPIILFVDSQTTGGYPVIANLASVDLPSAGQLRPGDTVTFEAVTFAEARRLLLEQEAFIAAI